MDYVPIDIDQYVVVMPVIDIEEILEQTVLSQTFNKVSYSCLEIRL